MTMNAPPEKQALYQKLCSEENIALAHKKARKGKTLKLYVKEFEKNLEENLKLLRNELLTQNYKPKLLTTFILRDPKTRKISKADFRDRTIHHAICNIIEPIFDKTFIHDSFANRIGNGTLNAIKRFDEFKRKASKNNTKICYVLKADVKHYFDTVNHKVLLEILRNKIFDENIINLIKLVLMNHNTKQEDKGMPLGNLTSQFFANVYLNELDQYIKHELKAEYYIRYVDDFVIFHTSKTKLKKYKKLIDKFLRNKLVLELHPEKSTILKLKKGINFLGFRIFYHHKLLGTKNKKRFERKLKELKKEYDDEKIEREEIIERFEGWLSYAKNADTYKQRKNITKQFNKLFSAKKDMKITSVKKHENLNQKIEKTNIEFTAQKTLQLFKQGYSIQKIAEKRNLKEGTIWQHIAKLVEHQQLQQKEILSNKKIKEILKNIKSPDDKLKEIKERIKNEAITYNEINIVLTNIKGKQQKKSINYFVNWYKKTNCHRKCYYNKAQRVGCRSKFQQLIAKTPNTTFTKEEFLEFFNNYSKICVLSKKEKEQHISWKEFKNKRKTKNKQHTLSRI